MAELTRVQNVNLNIASEAEVLNYTYTNGQSIEVIVRLDLGVPLNNVLAPIVGGGNYAFNMYINNVLVTPTMSDAVPSGQTSTVAASRAVPLYPGDHLSVRVLGRPGDTSVNVLATLRSSTPLQLSDIYGGGQVPVDHNYGGADALSYQYNGNGIVGATVYVYLASDWNAGNRGAQYIIGATRTGAVGRWVHPLMLSPATYVVVYNATGYGPDVINLTVS